MREEIVDNYLSKFKEFKPLLREIFARRQKVFGYTDLEIEKQIIRFSSRVTNIYLDGRKRKDFINGRFRAERQAIILYTYNIEKIAKSNNVSPDVMFFESFTHEVYHAVSNLNNGIAYRLRKYKNEAYNELAAFIGSIRYNRNIGIYKTYSYTARTFYPQLIAVACGIKIEDLLKESFNGIGHINRFIAEHYEEDLQDEIEERLQEMDDLFIVAVIAAEDKLNEYGKDFLGVTYHNLFDYAKDLAILRHDESEETMLKIKAMKIEYKNMLISKWGFSQRNFVGLENQENDESDADISLIRKIETNIEVYDNTQIAENVKWLKENYTNPSRIKTIKGIWKGILFFIKDAYKIKYGDEAKLLESPKK